MAQSRYNEFQEFLVDGKRRRFGELLMQGNEVYSYDRLIAYVDRNLHIVLWDGEAEGLSNTTSRHLNSVRIAERFCTTYKFVRLAGPELMEAYLNQPEKRESILGLSELKLDKQQ